MKKLIIIKIFLCSVSWVSSSIGGLTYMDPLNFGPYKTVQGEDACNPLYWYPKSMPDYCYRDKTSNAIVPLAPPPAIPMPPVFPQPYPVPPLIMPPLLISQPLLPAPMMQAPVSYPLLPITGPFPPSLPYQPQQQIGFLPGLPGIVSEDGGINILPFSDAYADLLEKHKQKMITKKYLKIVGNYDTYPWKSRRKSRCH